MINGKPLPISIVSMFVSIYTVIITGMLFATYIVYRNNITQILMLTPVVTGYIVTRYAYLAYRLRKEFKEGLGKTNKRPKMLFE